jgi:fibronectin type 3 domain-containing protein
MLLSMATYQSGCAETAANSPTQPSQPGSHSATVSWTASISAINGYVIYRGSHPGGPYARLNDSLNAGTSFTDRSVEAGQTYYYVVTAVDSNYRESSFSKEVVATIPTD